MVISSSLLAGLLNSLSLKCLLLLWLVNWAARPQTLRVGFVLPWCLYCCPSLLTPPSYSLDLQQYSSQHSSNKAAANRRPSRQPRNLRVQRVSDSCPGLSCFNLIFKRRRFGERKEMPPTIVTRQQPEYEMNALGHREPFSRHRSPQHCLLEYPCPSHVFHSIVTGPPLV